MSLQFHKVFAARCYASAAYAVTRCLSVCLSVRLSVCPYVTFIDSVETNKQFFNFFSPSVATPFYSLCTKHHGNIPPGTPPLTGALNAGGVGKNRDYRRIPGYRIDDCWS